jgi:hypothetical protein
MGAIRGDGRGKLENDFYQCSPRCNRFPISKGREAIEAPLPEREGIHLNPGTVPLAASAVSEEPNEEDPQPQPGEPRGGLAGAEAEMEYTRLSKIQMARDWLLETKPEDMDSPQLSTSFGLLPCHLPQAT